MHLTYGCNEIVHADVALKSIKIKCTTSMPVFLMFFPANRRWCLKRKKRRLLEKTHHSEKRPKLLRFYYRADNVPVYSPVKPIDLEM